MREAIQSLRIRGAPAIGIAGAYGLAIASERSAATNSVELLADMRERRPATGKCAPDGRQPGLGDPSRPRCRL